MEIPQGIELNFMPALEIRPEDKDKVYRIVLVDTTTKIHAVPYEIYSLQIRVQYADKEYNGDVLHYISTKRVDRELFVIEADMLGFPTGAVMPDGVYTVTMTVNNTYTRKHSFMLFYELEKEITKLFTDSGYKVTADQFNLQYQNSDKYDYETYSILASLLASIEQNMLDGDLDAANTAYVKAKKILKLL